MKIKLLLFLLLILLSSCFENQHYKSNKYACKVRNDAIDSLTKRYAMESTEFGCGGMFDCVQDLSLTFEIKGPKTKEELRRIMVDCLDTFLNAINNDKQVRPYLLTYPFTLEEIYLTIYVRDKNNGYVYYPEISSVSILLDGITYTTYDQEKKRTELAETYEEAKKIIQSENQHPNNIK